jgi:hypothetical protein
MGQRQGKDGGVVEATSSDRILCRYRNKSLDIANRTKDEDTR